MNVPDYNVKRGEGHDFLSLFAYQLLVNWCTGLGTRASLKRTQFWVLGDQRTLWTITDMSTIGGEDANEERSLKIYHLITVFRLPLSLSPPTTTIWYKQLAEVQIWLNIDSEKVFSNCEQTLLPQWSFIALIVYSSFKNEQWEVGWDGSHSGVHVSGSGEARLCWNNPPLLRWVKFTQKTNGKSRTKAAEICSQRSLSGTTLLLQVWGLIPILFSVQIPTKVETEKREPCQMTSIHMKIWWLKKLLT